MATKNSRADMTEVVSKTLRDSIQVARVGNWYPESGVIILHDADGARFRVTVQKLTPKAKELTNDHRFQLRMKG